MSDIKMIDKYQIVSVVGEGGMGKVFRAVHPTLKRDIIIKRLSISSKKILSERFRREARIMMDFHHESIVSVYDHFKHGASYYIAMEFVDGVPLDELIEKKKRIPSLAAALIFREICKGLKYAHDKGVIHRDIKPSNVLVSKAGEVKLFDFGIAALEEDEPEAEKDLTKTGMMMGTPSYMSPEQLADAKRVDKRSDIYSLGVMLYQMLTGKKPFPSNFTADTIRRISKGVYEKPRKSVPSLPRFFDKILKKSMHHKARKRYRDLDPVIHKLSRHLQKYKAQDEIHKGIKVFLQIQPDKDGSFDKIPRSKRSRLALVVAGAVLVLAGFVGVLFLPYTSLPGAYWELTASRELGSLEIRVTVPAGYYKNPADVFSEAKLTRRPPPVGNKPSKPEVSVYRPALEPALVRLFRPPVPKPETKPTVLTTNTLFLPAGEYQLDLTVEQDKYLRVFYLNPLAVQKQQPDSPEKKKIIDYRIVSAGPDEIPVFHTVRDAASKKPLGGDVKVFYFTNAWSEWKKADGVVPRGRRQRFRYAAEKYYTREIDVLLARDLDVLRLEIELQKIPGRLVLSSNSDELEILLDNRKEQWGGERNKSFMRFERTKKGEKSFALDEADYQLTLKKDEKTVANYSFSMEAGAIMRLDVKYDAQEKKINISPK